MLSVSSSQKKIFYFLTNIIFIALFEGCHPSSVVTYFQEVATNPTPPVVTPLVCDSTLTTSYGGGAGTTLSPYTICSLSQWNFFGGDSTNWNKAFRLESDIDFTGVVFSDFKMIGNNTTAFTGTFDGNGHTIKNITVNAGTNNVGLFLKTNSTVVISNLTLNNLSITSTGTVGPLVAAHGSLGSLTLNSITANQISLPNAGAKSGGLVGASSAPFIASQITLSTINVAGLANYFGGLIGNCLTDCTISNVTGNAIIRNTSTGGSYSACVVALASAGTTTLTDITITGSQMTALGAAGIIGRLGGATTLLTRVHYSGTVTSNNLAGGLFHDNIGSMLQNLTITDSSVQGTIYGGGGVGGFGSLFDGNITVSRSFIKGNIITGSNLAGGFFTNPGYSAGNTVTIDDSYVAATVQSVDATAGFAAGFLINAVDSQVIIRNSYFSADAVGNNQRACIASDSAPTGGFTANRVYYNSTLCTQPQSSSGAISGVTGLSTAALQTATPFTGWSTSNWVFTSGAYPKLIWEP